MLLLKIRRLEILTVAQGGHEQFIDAVTVKALSRQNDANWNGTGML
jgi:hypothetical protein